MVNASRNMGKTVAYILASTDRQDLNSQMLENLEFAWQKGHTVDQSIEIEALLAIGVAYNNVGQRYGTTDSNLRRWAKQRCLCRHLR